MSAAAPASLLPPEAIVRRGGDGWEAIDANGARVSTRRYQPELLAVLSRLGFTWRVAR